jgi:hypothetical protein
MKTKQLCRWSKEKGRKEKQKQGEKKNKANLKTQLFPQGWSVANNAQVGAGGAERNHVAKREIFHDALPRKSLVRPRQIFCFEQ